MIEIKHQQTGELLLRVDTDTLERADLHGAVLREADLSPLSLRESILEQADLRGANLRGADLRDVAALGVDLRKADLRDADLRGAMLYGALLSRTHLRGIRIDSETFWPRGFGRRIWRRRDLFVEPDPPPTGGRPVIEIRRLGGEEVILRIEAEALEGISLAGVDLSRARLRYTGFREAHLTGANLQGAHLAGASFEAADLAGANLQDAELIAVDFEATNLAGADLTGADLRYADLTWANLDGADLSGAFYTENTVWPDRFDPQRAGAVSVG